MLFTRHSWSVCCAALAATLLAFTTATAVLAQDATTPAPTDNTAVVVDAAAAANAAAEAAVDAADAAKAAANVAAQNANAVHSDHSAPTDDGTVSQFRVVFMWLLALVGSIAALIFAVRFYKDMMKCDEGTEEMITIAAAVREGAWAYLKRQYRTVAIVFVILAMFLAFLAFGLEVQSRIVPFAFLTGGLFSGLAGFFGMVTATHASNRTAAGAQKSLNQGLQVAFRSGAVMGLTVVGLGLIDIVIWFAILYWGFPKFGVTLTLEQITVTMLCFGMGASTQALFARVGGGIFTKAADVGADLVGKVEAGIPEDDKRNPATIADNVGDNVGDVAGMGADLYESYCGSILATAALGVAAFYTQAEMLNAIFLPMIIASAGIFLSIMGIYLVKTEEQADQGTLLKALARGVDISSILIGILSIGLAYFFLNGQWNVGVSVVVGLAAGWIIGKWTEYSTSDEYKPTRDIAEQALTGPATVIIAGVAGGMYSVWVPVLVVGAATLLAFGCSNGFNFTDVNLFALGLYGVGIAAVGMLSTLGITLATDAYGPIADNAGGNAEMSGLDPEVRKRTDALDSLGNTTAATGKGFAIGSAALTALALLAAYVEEVRMGFEHWGDAAIKVVARADDAAGTTYKINDRFVVKSNGAGKEAHKFIAMPESVADGNIKGTWEKIAFGAKIDPSILKDDVAHDAKNNVVPTLAFAATGAKLVPVKTATMMDWMTYYRCNLMNPKVIVGVFIGAMATFVFCAMTMQAVGRAAYGMVDEVRRQFREHPGIMDYTEKPDYARPVDISTAAAQREMMWPSFLGLFVPLATGMVLGVTGVIGLLVGTLTCGFCVAVFMANAGGAWDNAKKYIEAGHHGGKRSDAHKAAVVGDTVGDPFKDTSGPSLNILIKLMNMVSVVAAGLVVRFSFEAMGWF
ncbi:MAG: sodium-translocating pyrophosphatase [Thermoguttaceae bacterium]